MHHNTLTIIPAMFQVAVLEQNILQTYWRHLNMLGPMLNLFFPSSFQSPDKHDVGLSQFDAMNQSLKGLSSAYKQKNPKNAFQQWMEPSPVPPIQSIQPSIAVNAAVPIQNPFMVQPAPSETPTGNSASLLNTRALPRDYGINKPLEKAMFLGYHNDKPLLCGQNLFITC